MSNFFTEMEPITDEVEVSLTIKSKGGIISVLVMPKATSTKIKQITISGTAAELDAGFIESIKQPLKSVAGMQVNVGSGESGVVKSKPISEPKKVVKAP